jgi:rhodanese-related sulfurtransferase
MLMASAFAVASAASAFAQDSFGSAPASAMPLPADAAPSSVPAGSRASVRDVAPARYGTAPTLNMPASRAGAEESQDYGVPAQDTLRPSEALHAPTPTALPGARTIDTATLASLLRDPQRRPLLFHVLGSMEHLPGAIAAAPAGQGGGFDDAAQGEFGRFLQGMSRGDASRAMVFYCGGTHCWMSYNAALRAVHLGYRNVAWYRGGLEAWRNAGLPIESAGDARGAPNAAPARTSFDGGESGSQPLR